ncbi:MAG TPA: hypothetical protein VK985_03115 [Rariglobus sp.]|nr:hypothetical protein [Rariglobus sp.]
MRTLFKRYILRIGTVMVTGLILSFVLTTAVDPWRVNRMPWMLDGLDIYRDFSDHHRTGKAGLAKDPAGWDVAYIGSSRIEIGLATDPIGLVGRRVVNLGLPGGMTKETMAMARYALDHNPRMSLLVIGVDCGDLTSTLDISRQTDFFVSPLADGQFSLDRQLRYWIGVRAVEESILTLSNYFKGAVSKYTPQGQRPRVLGSFPDIRAHVSGRFRFYQSQARAFDSESIAPVNSEKRQLIKEVLIRARGAGIRVIVIIPPRHVLTQIHRASDVTEEAPWARDRRALAELCSEANRIELSGPLIELRDFYTFNTLTSLPLPKIHDTDQGLPEWYDLEHFPPSVGTKLLGRLFSEGQQAASDPDWGVDVLAVGIDSHLARLREQHTRYCQANPADVAWMRSQVLNAGTRTGP